MWEIPKNYKIKLGGNYFINCESLISFKDEPVFRRIEKRDTDGKLGLDFDVYDKKGQKIATIRRGNVVQGNTQAYEMMHLADCDKVVEKSSGRIIVEINKKQSDADIAVSVNMYLPNGLLLEATPENININTIKMRGNTISNCKIGIAIV
jgi:hypothetical protein